MSDKIPESEILNELISKEFESFQTLGPWKPVLIIPFPQDVFLRI